MANGNGQVQQIVDNIPDWGHALDDVWPDLGFPGLQKCTRAEMTTIIDVVESEESPGERLSLTSSLFSRF